MRCMRVTVHRVLGRGARDDILWVNPDLLRQPLSGDAVHTLRRGAVTTELPVFIIAHNTNVHTLPRHTAPHGPRREPFRDTHQGGEKVGFGDSMTNGFRVQEGTKIWRPEVSGGRSAPSAMGGLHRPRWAVCTVIGGRSAPSSMGGMHRPRRREGCVAQLGGWLVKAPACC